jgi:dCMP deaminase
MERPDLPQLSFDEYYMGLAIAVRRRANCVGTRVGAILVKDNRVRATGYNGVPEHMTNCVEGGCERCANREKYGGGEAYDLCICVHAEQNALMVAARYGIAVNGALIYTTVRPCFGCTKELLQAGVVGVRYLYDWKPRPEAEGAYRLIQGRFGEGIKRVVVLDPDEAWAMPPRSRELPAGGQEPAIN